MKRTRAALYARKSADEKLSRSSDVNAQVREIKKWADENGFSIIMECIDDGIKGWTPPEARPGLSQIADAIRSRKKPFEAVIVASWDRLFRNYGEASLLLGEFEANSIRVISTREGEPKDATSKSGRDIMLFLAQLENATRGRHILGGQKDKAAHGYSPGGRPPYGYKRAHAEDARGVFRVKYEVEPTEAAVVQEIYRRYAAGESIDVGLARHHVYKILFKHQEKYLGSMTYNRTRFHKKYKKSTPKGPEDWVSCPNAHEPIITQAMADAVNNRHKNGKR